MTRQKPLQVGVGSRYILKLPRGLSYRDQLWGLKKELESQWLTWRAEVEDIEDAEPLWVHGHHVVTVRDTAVIEPVSDEGPELDEYGVPCLDVNGKVIMRFAQWEPLPGPVPAVVIHLTRHPWQIEARVVLTEGQIADLNLDLDPRDRYVIHGRLFELHGDEDVEVPEVIEERDFTVPVTWLRSLDSVRAWSSKAHQQHDRDLLTLAALPEIEQEWLRVEAQAQEAEAYLQIKTNNLARDQAWVRDSVPAEDRPGWQKLLDDRQSDYDMAKEWAIKYRQEADWLRPA